MDSTSLPLIGVPLAYYFGSQLIGAGTPDILETAAVGVVAPLGATFAAANGVFSPLGDQVKFAPPAASATASYLMSNSGPRAALGAGATYMIYPEVGQPGPSCSVQ